MACAQLSEAEIARRLPVWSAMSRLFLDTQPDAADYGAIAAAIRAAGLGPDEAYVIFVDEVAPAFAANLRVIAGEWAGWSEAFVRERVLAGQRSRLGRPLTRLLDRAYLAAEWAKIASSL